MAQISMTPLKPAIGGLFGENARDKFCKLFVYFFKKKTKFVQQTIFTEKATLFSRFSINNSLLEFSINRRYFSCT